MEWSATLYQNRKTKSTGGAPPFAVTTKRVDPEIEAALDLLCQTFPKAFVRYEARRRPLKIGIRDDLRVALDGAMTDTELGRALRVYCTNHVYRSRLVAGAARIDLDGTAAGIVSTEHACKPKAPSPRPIKRLPLAEICAKRHNGERRQP